MRWAILIIGGSAASILLFVSALLNFRFGYGLGATQLDGLIYGSASAAADVLKAALGIAILLAVAQRNWFGVIAGAILFSCCTAFSLTSAAGFASVNRSKTIGASEIHATLNREYVQALTADRAELAGLQARLKQRLKWRERGRMERRAKVLETRIANAKKALGASLAASTTLLRTHPQSETIAALIGRDAKQVETGLAALLALMIEFGSGIGLATVWSVTRQPPAKRLPKTLAPMSITEPSGGSKLYGSNVSSPSRVWTVQSAVRHFLNKNTKQLKGSVAGATALHQSYCRFAREHGLPWLSQKDFGVTLRALGFEKRRRGPKGAVAYLDIRLADAA
ncbi:hypothetical protein MnTg02_01658 [bacterium MnTg02]|nr:hypothetical protein MnTg02_01658 [bacterium MnTg02]